MMRSCVLLILLVQEYCVLSQMWLFPPAVELDPRDSLVFFGETLFVHCKFPSTVSNSDISIDVEVHGKIFTPSEMNITVEDGDKTAITRFLVNESFGEIQNPTIECRVGNSSTERDSTFLYPEFPIRNITNFTGIFYDDENKIILSWDFGPYISPNAITVDVDYNPNSPPNKNGSYCTQQTKSSCIIGNYLQQDILFIRVVVRVTRNRPDEKYLMPLHDVSATSVHRFKPADHRKTAPPTGFVVVDQNNTCMILNWTNPEYFKNCNQCDSIYHIDVKGEGDTEFIMVVDNEIRPRSEAGKPVEICSLRPFTLYTVRLTVRAREGNPWSDPVFAEGRTDEDE